MPQPEFGATAWGRAWLRTVERTDRVPNPALPRARSLARNQKASLTVGPGTITADVTDGAATRHVSIHLPCWDDREQTAAGSLLAGTPTNSIVGDLPDRLLDTLTAAGVTIAVPLVSTTAACDCRSRTHPCVHVLTALYAFVLLTDERPLTALEVRTSEPSPQSQHTDPDWIPLSTLDAASFYTAATAPGSGRIAGA